MDALNSEALDGFNTAIEALLPDVADPSVQHTLLVTTVRIAPTGLGGFVGANEDPQGEILGRNLEAIALVMVRANDVDPLNDAVAAVVRAFLGAERPALLQQGILRIALDGIGAQSVSGSGSNRVAERNLSFKVLYEFLKRPEESEDLILEVPVNLDAS